MHKSTFFPLGNADSCRVDLEGGRKRDDYALLGERLDFRVGAGLLECEYQLLDTLDR